MKVQNYIIVCPTPKGGHIEHAIEMAIALRSSTAGSTLLVSRPGASTYAKEVTSVILDIKEVIPPLSQSKSSIKKACDLAINLRREYAALRSEILQLPPGDTTVIVEEPRYPSLAPLRTVRQRSVRVVGIVHNAREHESVRSVIGWLKSSIKQLFIRSADLIVVNGTAQKGSLRRSDIVIAQLPRVSQLAPGARDSIRSDVLCIGEIRRNKGIEFAILACGEAEMNLTVAGSVTEDHYEDEFASLVRRSSDAVEFIDRFLPANEFEARIAGARIVLLPYSRFDAQSGVLARAMQLGRAVVCSDHPSLREQSAGYGGIRFVRFGDVNGLARELEGHWVSEWYATGGGGIDDNPHAAWKEYVHVFSAEE